MTLKNNTILSNWTKVNLLNILEWIIVGFLFYLIITPCGLILKLFNRKTLDIIIDKKCNTYWLVTKISKK